MQLAETLDTSIANISQQLRLMEVAGIVKKERLKERAKGKPRVVFSLKNDMCYLITATDGFADKRLLDLDEFHKYVLKVWSIENKALHEQLSLFFLLAKEQLGKIQVIVQYTQTITHRI